MIIYGATVTQFQHSSTGIDPILRCKNRGRIEVAFQRLYDFSHAFRAWTLSVNPLCCIGVDMKGECEWAVPGSYSRLEICVTVMGGDGDREGRERANAHISFAILTIDLISSCSSVVVKFNSNTIFQCCSSPLEQSAACHTCHRLPQFVQRYFCLKEHFHLKRTFIISTIYQLFYYLFILTCNIMNSFFNQY